MENDDVDMHAADTNEAELDDMKKRLKEMEDEAAALREMQAKVQKEMGSVQDPSTASASQANREEIDSRSVFVGNLTIETEEVAGAEANPDIIHSETEAFKLHKAAHPSTHPVAQDCSRDSNDTVAVAAAMVDYSCTPEEVQQHFQSCGTVNRVTIRTDKFGQPKGYAYVEFLETDAVQEALLLNESELHGRQLKVTAKRTNIPGIKQFRGRRSNPYMGGFRGRAPYAPPFIYSPYGYGFQGSECQCATAPTIDFPILVGWTECPSPPCSIIIMVGVLAIEYEEGKIQPPGWFCEDLSANL
ncbi:Polyadenylate-binding protein 3, partial [Mucuna pruriens]